MGFENSGRRPKPTAVRLLQGNPGKRPLNPHEPQPPTGPVEKPTGLGLEAATVWDELAPVCVQMGTLTRADQRPFVTLCELEVKAAIARELTRRAKPSKRAMAIRLELQIANTLRPYYALFGLEPISRARIAVPQMERVNEWAELG